MDDNDAIAKFNEAFEDAQGFPWEEGAKVDTLITQTRKLLGRVKDIEENSRGSSKKGRFDTYFTAISLRSRLNTIPGYWNVICGLSLI